jgi:PEP-CTERM/exosortase A-associated glycosyltransferase
MPDARRNESKDEMKDNAHHENQTGINQLELADLQDQLRGALNQNKELHQEILKQQSALYALSREKEILAKRVEEMTKMTAELERRLKNAGEKQTEMQAFYEDQLNEKTAEMMELKMTVRYKLGDAIILALKPGKDTLLLPGRIFRLLIEGISHYQQRKSRSGAQAVQHETAAGTTWSADGNMGEIKQVRDIKQLKKSFYQCQGNERYEIGRRLYRRLKDTGKLNDSRAHLETMKRIKPLSRFIEREINIVHSQLELLERDPVELFGIQEKPAQPVELSGAMSVLHVLNTSIPYLNNGYGIRSQNIISHQKKRGLVPVIITRPGFPNGIRKGKIKTSKELMVEIHDGIKYYRALPNLIKRFSPEKDYIRSYAQIIEKVIEKESIEIVHAASNYVIGLSGLLAARQTRKPFVYEVRGFWELTTVSKEPDFKNSDEYRLAQKLETFLCQQADHVTVISQGLKNELISRRIEETKISVVPNGVDCSRFRPLIRDMDLVSKYALAGKFVIGYIGSITKYEGLQRIISILPVLLQKHQHICLLIAGEGKYLNELKKLAADNQLDEQVIFAGKIDYTEVERHYSLFDLCIFPRIEDEVTHLVTPLKPLEAMACGKAVIGSDLDAMREMIIQGKNGLLYDHTEQDLMNKVLQVIEDSELRIKLGRQAREWVEENREWSAIVQQYEEIYQSAAASLDRWRV